MKIMVTGYSGSGKSTICRRLQERYQLPVLHLDAVQFLPGWKVRAKAGQQRIVQTFLNEHPDGQGLHRARGPAGGHPRLRRRAFMRL